MGWQVHIVIEIITHFWTNLQMENANKTLSKYISTSVRTGVMEDLY